MAARFTVPPDQIDRANKKVQTDSLTDGSLFHNHSSHLASQQMLCWFSPLCYNRGPLLYSWPAITVTTGQRRKEDNNSESNKSKGLWDFLSYSAHARKPINKDTRKYTPILHNMHTGKANKGVRLTFNVFYFMIMYCSSCTMDDMNKKLKYWHLSFKSY